MKPLNRIKVHFRASETPGPEPASVEVAPIEVVGGLACSCGCGMAAMSIRLGSQVLLIGSAEAAAALADAIRAAAAETWEGGER